LARAATENVGLFPKLAVSNIKQDKKQGQAFRGELPGTGAWENRQNRAENESAGTSKCANLKTGRKPTAPSPGLG
jgi:hypothetical protein